MNATITTHPASHTVPVSESPFWRVSEAASYAKVHPAQIFRACRERKLEHVRVSGKRTILTKREFVEAWLDSMRVPVKPA